jgi:hypothetical protein
VFPWGYAKRGLTAVRCVMSNEVEVVRSVKLPFFSFFFPQLVLTGRTNFYCDKDSESVRVLVFVV